jgi:hypothetical protein
MNGALRNLNATSFLRALRWGYAAGKALALPTCLEDKDWAT